VLFSNQSEIAPVLAKAFSFLNKSIIIFCVQGSQNMLASYNILLVWAIFQMSKSHISQTICPHTPWEPEDHQDDILLTLRLSVSNHSDHHRKFMQSLNTSTRIMLSAIIVDKGLQSNPTIEDTLSVLALFNIDICKLSEIRDLPNDLPQDNQGCCNVKPLVPFERQSITPST